MKNLFKSIGITIALITVVASAYFFFGKLVDYLTLKFNLSIATICDLLLACCLFPMW